MWNLIVRLLPALLTLTVALFSLGVYAHNKVVVIPMAGDPPPLEAVTPVAPVDTAASNYTVMLNAGDNTVLDKTTGLEWLRENDNSYRAWEDAFDYCDDLNDAPSFAGKTHWRLPTITELQSIVDYGAFNPSIEVVSFTGANSSNYWSASSVPSNSGYAWYVSFSIGNTSYGNKNNTYYVRCVR